MKDSTPYFTHDCNARNDEKMLIIRSKYSYEGYGWYFALIEMLRESTDYTLSKNVALLRLCLNITEAKQKDFEDCFNLFFEVGLFVFCSDNSDRFFSESFMQRMSLVDEKRRLRAEAGRLGGLRKHSNAKATPEQNNSKDLASKEKKNKEKKNIENLIYPFNSEKFISTWNMFLEMRKNIKKAYKSELSKQKQLDKLGEVTEATAIKMLENSIANEWQGVFAIKSEEQDISFDVTDFENNLTEKINTGINSNLWHLITKNQKELYLKAFKEQFLSTDNKIAFATALNKLEAKTRELMIEFFNKEVATESYLRGMIEFKSHFVNWAKLQK